MYVYGISGAPRIFFFCELSLKSLLNIFFRKNVSYPKVAVEPMASQNHYTKQKDTIERALDENFALSAILVHTKSKNT